MKDIQTEYIELQDGRVNRNEWGRLLGRLDAVGDEIDRALNWTRIANTPKGALSGSTLILYCG